MVCKGCAMLLPTASAYRSEAFAKGGAGVSLAPQRAKCGWVAPTAIELPI